MFTGRSCPWGPRPCFRFFASLLRRLKAGVSGILLFGAHVWDGAWHHAFSAPDEPDVDAMVDQRVAEVIEDLTSRREARLKREFAPVGPTDLPKPRVCPPSRSAIPDVVDPRREPERYACLQALRHTTRTMFGPDTAPLPDLTVLSDAQTNRLLSLGTPALAAPVHREMVRRLGWDGVDGWWWPHRAQPRVVPSMARGAGGGAGLRFG